MSFDINWETLISDGGISDYLKIFLDEQFNSITLPSFIDKLSVSNFSMGSTPPEISIRHIGAPFDDFYAESQSDDEDRQEPIRNNNLESESDDASSSEDEGGSSRHAELKTEDVNTIPFFNVPYKDTDGVKYCESSKKLHSYSMNNVGLRPHEKETPATFFKSNKLKLPSHPSPSKDKSTDTSDDVQFTLDIDYRGDMMIEISANLLMNYPSAQFISLPIKLKITDLEIRSLAAVAYIRKNIYVSFLCDLHATTADYFSMPNEQGYNALSGTSSLGNMAQEGNFVDYANTNNKERIDVIRNVKIDTEIGETEHNVLRNVGKVEKFLVEQLRNIIRDEVCWPSWVCFNLDDGDGEDDEEVENDTRENDDNNAKEDNENPEIGLSD